jgi:hypothetical protein
MDQTATKAAAQDIDPEQAAQLARRVRRMMLVAGLTTALGMAAILVTIGYRLFRGEGSVTTDIIATLPKGARIVSTAVANDRLVVTLDVAGSVEIRTFDAHSLKQTGRLRFATEP